MKALVLGAGVIGVTTAHALNRRGWDVRVLDRQPGPGLETSFANGGQISANHAEPWANPRTLSKVLKWLGDPLAPLRIHWRLDRDLADWCLRFLLNCRQDRAQAHLERALRVALYSRACLSALRAETGLQYEQASRGILHIYDDAADFETALPSAKDFSDLGCRRDVLSAEACLALEPALAGMAGGLLGGIFSPDDESGDAHLFTQNLCSIAQGAGVKFDFASHVLGVETESGAVSGIRTDRGTVRADAYILALGSFSPLLLKPLGVRLPVQPAKGYSVTLEVGDRPDAPRVALIDDRNKIVFSRLGTRLRVAGMAELAGYDDRIDARRARHILDTALNVFPALPRPVDPQTWAGLRPLTPDNLPILGPSPLSNLWLNTGHGTLGWTMAAGSAEIVADLVSGREAEIDLDGLTLNRF
ncbi:MAG: D-amino acid dehydrogenase [Rhodospirillales bacterium]